MEWCMAHPWMTFILILVGLSVIADSLTAIAKIMIRIKGKKKDSEEVKG